MPSCNSLHNAVFYSRSCCTDSFVFTYTDVSILQHTPAIQVRCGPMMQPAYEVCCICTAFWRSSISYVG
jgi:hypothetical protein